jgi:hypothetical protein
MKRASLGFVLTMSVALTACGGGGGNSAPVTPPPPPVPQSISISSNGVLPKALQGQAYSTTLTASNGQGALKWSITPIAPITFPDGLTIDTATGVISGIPTTVGGASFMATVTDANSKSASKQFDLAIYGKLTAGVPKSYSFYQYQDISFGQLDIQGGVPPLHFTLTSGALPPGVRVTGQGQLMGSPLRPGSYSGALTVSDSWSTPQTAMQAVSFTVSTASLYLHSNVTGNLQVGQPTNAALFPMGGVAPYTYSLTSGTLPPGLTLDNSTGKFLGTPTTIGYTQIVAKVQDSVGNTSICLVSFNIVNLHGRNDTIQTATLTTNGVIYASLSPYIDPPNKAPLAADTDYYKIVSMAGTLVNLSMISAGGPIDPVIEVLDANGVRLSTCNSVDLASTNHTSPCVNDDAFESHNAGLEYKVPGDPGTVVNSYIHALDWAGIARPDMQYYMNINGNIEPLYYQIGATRNVPYNYQVYLPYSPYGNSTWTVDNGSLPDGLSLSPTGVISGTATTDGDYSFRLKAVDQYSQTYYVFITMTVGEPS